MADTELQAALRSAFNSKLGVNAKAVSAASADTAAACTGNSASATKLATARTVSVYINGQAAGSFTFDGSGDVRLDLTMPLDETAAGIEAAFIQFNKENGIS